MCRVDRDARRSFDGLMAHKAREKALAERDPSSEKQSPLGVSGVSAFQGPILPPLVTNSMTRYARAALFLAASLVAPAVRAASPLTPAAQWSADVAALADDRNEGRAPGTPGYDRAAAYVVARFRALGLKPAGVAGYFQPVALERQTVDQDASTAALTVAGGPSAALKVGEAVLISAGGGPRPAGVDAPMVFIGYGLSLPGQARDDFAGLDLKGKIAVVISGGPADLSGPVKSQARFARAARLGQLGAVGLVTLVTPHQVEIPWARQKLLARGAGMYLADPELRETPDGFFTASVDPGAAQRLFEGSGRTFAELSALADASAALPRFDLIPRLSATLVAHREPLSSPNLVAVLPGRDPVLKSQYVGVSAHLDHLGVGAAINGDSIYNGAMDDASGVAAVLDIAARLKAHRPRRSMLFVIVTAEEKGLLGSYYFARRPTVAKAAIVADLNFDMPLPLWPLKTVIAQGEAESTLGAAAHAAAAPLGLAVVPDPVPDRNSFIRTDQFSFVREGVPALAFKFGFARDTPQFQIEHDWRATRYHAPSDDLGQPGVLPEEAVRLDEYVAAIARRVADAPDRPHWLPTSVFATP